MNEEISDQSTPSIPNKSSNKSTKSNKPSPRKSQKTPSENVVQAQGKTKQSDMLKWTIFVRPEVRTAVRMAAKKAGVSDTEWMDTQLWELAKADLAKKPQPPVKAEDVADILKQFTNTMQASQDAAQAAQAAIVKEQGNIIQQQTEQLAALQQTVEAVVNKPEPSPLTFKEMLFGRSKERI